MYYEVSDTAAAIRSVQKFLLEIAYSADWLPFVSIDGVYGPATAGAVLLFQRRYGLPPTGVVDRATLLLLRNEYKAAREINQALPHRTE